MGWLIAGLLVLLLIGGLIAFARVREHDRQPADDSLLAELLGEDDQPPPPPPPSPPPPSPSPVAPAMDDTVVLPPARTTDGTEILPVVPPRQSDEVQSAEAQSAREAPAEPPPAPAPVEPAERPAPATPAEDGDWLESQLAWIRNWSQRMQEQIGPGGGQEPDRRD